MSFLLDTNIISELSKPRPDAKVLAWVAKVPHASISAVTLEELRFGLGANPIPRLELWLDEVLLQVANIGSSQGRVGGHSTRNTANPGPGIDTG